MPDKEGSEDKKKSVKKEELDLTKIAEAFGGYIIEVSDEQMKKNKNRKIVKSLKRSDDENAAKEVEKQINAAKSDKKAAQMVGMDALADEIKKSPTKAEKLAAGMKKKREERFGTDLAGTKVGTSTPAERKKERAILRKATKGTADVNKPLPKPAPAAFVDPETDPFDFPSDAELKAIEKGTQKSKEKKPTGQKLDDTTKTIGKLRTYRDPSVISSKFRKPKPTQSDPEDERKAARAFKKDIGGEKIISATMQDKLEKTAAKPQPRSARKRRSDAKSFAQVKAEIDAADARRREKGIGEYEKRLQKAYDQSLQGTVKTGQFPQGRPLPPAETKTPQGQPQKGQADKDKAAQEFNKQQNIQRRLQRQGMADSGATPFKQPPLPERDPSRRPKSELTFSKFQQDRQKRLDQNKKDMEAADAYKQTPEYALQTQQKDPKTGELLSKDELKRRFQMTRQGNKQQIDRETPKDQGRIDLNRDSLKSGIGGFERGRQGTLTRRGSDPRNEKSPNVETMPQQIGRKAKTMLDKTQTMQQSYLGALGGLITKGVSSSAAGAEAGMRYARGDKGGAALSALQGLGGGVGFAAGVANAIRSVRMARGGKTAGLAKVVPPEDLGMAAAAGGAVIPQVKGVLDKLRSSGLPTAKGGKAGLRRAKGGGGV